MDLITDAFALSGVDFSGIPTPFDGSFTPVVGVPNIGSTPTRAQAAVAAAVAGRRKLDFHAVQLRLAPSLNWEPSPKWQFGLQAGLAVGFGFSQLNFGEQITVADPATPVISQSGRSADTHAWAGLFSALRHQGPTRSAELDLSSGLGLSVGTSWRF